MKERRTHARALVLIAATALLSAGPALASGVEVGDVRFAALRDRLQYFHARYEDVELGDHYALPHSPGVGTELSKNGHSLAVLAGSDFAAACFAMWLGDDPIDAGLRDALRTRISERARN